MSNGLLKNDSKRSGRFQLRPIPHTTHSGSPIVITINIRAITYCIKTAAAKVADSRAGPFCPPLTAAVRQKVKLSVFNLARTITAYVCIH
jgi:hypothetical protein